MNNLFECTSSNWVRYSEYEWKAAEDGTLHYEDYDKIPPEQRQLIQKGMQAFGGIASTYRIDLLDKPTIVQDFHSLMLGVQMVFSFMLADSEKPSRICRHCQQTFVANRSSAVFCIPQCKNKCNVYKTYSKNKGKEGDDNA